MKLLVNQVIPFSNVEGQGNRFAIFLQGCDVRCVYCHNPETIPIKSAQAKLYEVDELVEMASRYKTFIRGITVSGGEPTLQSEALVELFYKVRKLGLTCYLDSNGFFDFESKKKLIENTDKFLYDIKGSGKSLSNLCFSRVKEFGEARISQEELKYTIDNALESIQFKNLKKLLEMSKVEEVRIVCIEGFHSLDEVVSQVSEAISSYTDVMLKLIRVHIRGSSKSVGGSLKKNIPTKAKMQNLENIAKDRGVKKVIVIL